MVAEYDKRDFGSGHVINFGEIWVMLDALSGPILKHLRGCVVEIGTSYGDIIEAWKSTNILTKYAKMFNRQYYTCDIKKHVVVDYKNHKHFAGPSLEFIKQFPENETPALVFLDGAHEHEIVIQEALFFLDKMTDHGIMFLHDTCPMTQKLYDSNNCRDSWKTRQELEKMRDVCDCFTWRFTARRAGLTMVTKKPKDRPFYQQ